MQMKWTPTWRWTQSMRSSTGHFGLPDQIFSESLVSRRLSKVTKTLPTRLVLDPFSACELKFRAVGKFQVGNVAVFKGAWLHHWYLNKQHNITLSVENNDTCYTSGAMKVASFDRCYICSHPRACLATCVFCLLWWKTNFCYSIKREYARSSCSVPLVNIPNDCCCLHRWITWICVRHHMTWLSQPWGRLQPLYDLLFSETSPSLKMKVSLFTDQHLQYWSLCYKEFWGGAICIQTDTGGETARAKLVLMMCDLEMILRGKNTTTYWQRATWFVTRTDRNRLRFWLGHVHASVWQTLSSSWCPSPNALLRTTLAVRVHNGNSLIAGSVSIVTVLLSSAEAFEYMTLDLNKVPGQGLGLSIVGRRWDCTFSDVCVVSILEWYWLLYFLSFSFLFNLTLCDFLYRNDTGVFVSDVVNGGVAQADGRLQPGDQILSVNGEDLSNATQEIAAGVLKVSYYD